jgi:siroheme decarboxylase
MPASFLYRLMLTEIEKKIIASIQGDIPIVKRPYARISKQIDITEEILLKTLKKLCENGVIRRFGATLRHQNSGFESNAMAAWIVDEERIEEVGRKFASFRQVSHCYRRNPTGKWPYNLYTMIHARDENSCREAVRMMSEAASVYKYAVLFSRRELKKTSMKYFSTDT